MSTAFGGFVVHEDGQENLHNPVIGKAKRDEMAGKMPATKRPALGTITNSHRVQPFRVAKQVSAGEGLCMRSENAPSALGSKTFGISTSQTLQGFNIHVDEDVSRKHIPTKKPEVSEKQLHSLAALRPALATINDPIIVEDASSSPEDSFADSPMILDSSACRDLAEEHFSRILCVPEYAEEIYSYLLEFETKYRPKCNYLQRQPDINSSMRCILVDWLVEVAEEYQLHRETLCLSVNYIDRFLSEMSVLRGKLQLVGAAAMFLAAKFEEIYPPEVKEFVYITDDTYTQKQVLRMEHLVLKVLSFNVAIPTANVFAEKYLDILGVTEKDNVYSLTMYLVELSMLEADPFLKYVPSTIAAASTCLACRTLDREPWSQHMSEKTGFQISDFEECVRNLHQLFSRAHSHPQKAIQEKYKQSKYHQVSTLRPLPMPTEDDL